MVSRASMSGPGDGSVGRLAGRGEMQPAPPLTAGDLTLHDANADPGQEAPDRGRLAQGPDSLEEPEEDLLQQVLAIGAGAEQPVQRLRRAWRKSVPGLELRLAIAAAERLGDRRVRRLVRRGAADDAEGGGSHHLLNSAAKPVETWSRIDRRRDLGVNRGGWGARLGPGASPASGLRSSPRSPPWRSSTGPPTWGRGSPTSRRRTSSRRPRRATSARTATSTRRAPGSRGCGGRWPRTTAAAGRTGRRSIRPPRSRWPAARPSFCTTRSWRSSIPATR